MIIQSKKKMLAGMVCLLMVVACSAPATEDAKSSARIDSLSHQVTRLQTVEAQEEANKKMVAEFYQRLFGDKDVSAIDQYIDEAYIQHNPMLPDGRAALKAGATQWFQGAPKTQIDIRHLSADGDLVYIHTRAELGGKVMSVIDVFRIAQGRIAEHWDVIQEVPEKSANDHPMF